MAYYWYLILFVFGLAAGSFLNVITLRFQPGQKILDRRIIGGRSHCLTCLKKLNWYELIPIFSFFFQRGKCRGCGQRISWQYPVVEILSGLIFVFVSLKLANFFARQAAGLSEYLILISVIWLVVFFLLLLLSIIDLRHSIIPNKINLSLGVLGLILIITNNYFGEFNSLKGSFLGHYAAIFGLRENVFINYSFAALLGMLIFGAIIFLTRGRAMGWGDFKFVIALGLIFGWPDILMVILLAFIIGAILGIISLIYKKKKMKDAIAFGPFLSIGSALTFFFGYQIIDGYFKIFNL